MENNREGKTRDLFNKIGNTKGTFHAKISTILDKNGKDRDLFKKIRYTKGTFHARMGMTKDRNGNDLTEAEEIKKRWQECTEKLYKKGLNDLDNHDGVVTHLEPDILDCEVKRALHQVGLTKHHYKQSYWR